MIEQTYRIDMIPNGAPVVVHVSQYDTAARRLSFELYNGGVAYELPAGAVASIAGTKPDNTSFLYAMTVSGNLASIDLQQQMALVAGDVLTEIQITGSEGKIGSANFIIRVERGPIDENSVISETDLPIFEQLVSDAQAAANEAQAAAEDAADAAESVGSIVPASAGTPGQVLAKTATGADWVDNQSLPSTGTTGQILTKTATGSAWADKYPSGGTAGQYLQKTANGEQWATPFSVVVKNVTLLSASWSTDSYTITDSDIKADSMVILTYPATTSDADYETLQSAGIRATAQAAGSITLKATGDVPASDVVITMIIWG